MSIEILLTLSALTNRAVEGVKRIPAFDRIPEEWRDEVLLVISNVFAIIAVFGLASDQNLFASFPGVPHAVGLLFTGVIVASGANAIHYVVDLLNRRTPDVAVLAVSEFEASSHTTGTPGSSVVTQTITRDAA